MTSSVHITESGCDCEAVWLELTRLLKPPSILRRNEPVAKKTTLRVGGAADFYAEPSSEQELADLVRYCETHNLPIFVLGRGSNLIVQDGGFRGLVISMSNAAFATITVSGNLLSCGAGTRLKHVAVEARRLNLGGLAFLEGIPGSVGGALRMNAGAMGSAFFEVVESVRFVSRNGDIREQKGSDCHPQYRSCAFFKDHIAIGAVLKGIPSSRQQITVEMEQFSSKRWESQPAAPSAGCIFKNPTTIPAGKLIDELGLKGTRIGGASISEVHGNFIINEGNAKAADILALIDFVKTTAKSKRGIQLETEVQVVGEP